MPSAKTTILPIGLPRITIRDVRPPAKTVADLLDGEPLIVELEAAAGWCGQVLDAMAGEMRPRVAGHGGGDGGMGGRGPVQTLASREAAGEIVGLSLGILEGVAPGVWGMAMMSGPGPGGIAAGFRSLSWTRVRKIEV